MIVVVLILASILGGISTGYNFQPVNLVLSSGVSMEDHDFTLDLILLDAPNGLAGFDIEISTLDPNTSFINDATFPAFGLTSQNTTHPNKLRISAADLAGIADGALSNFRLATISMSANHPGMTNLSTRIIALDDDNGDVIISDTPSASIVINPRIAVEQCLRNYELEFDEKDNRFYNTIAFRENSMGWIDLTYNDRNSGAVLVAYDTVNSCTDSNAILTLSTADLNTELRPLELLAIANQFGRTPNEFTETTIQGVIWELFTEFSDPAQVTGLHPLIGSTRTNKIELVIPGHGKVREENFIGKNKKLAIDVFKYRYNRMVLAGVNIANLKRNTGNYALAYDVSPHTLLDAKYAWHGFSLPPSYMMGNFDVATALDSSNNFGTTFGDTCTDSDGTFLDAHTPTGPNAGTSWVNFSAEPEILTNRCRSDDTASTESISRMTDKLSVADDMECIADLRAEFMDQSHDSGILCSFDDTATITEDFYNGNAQWCNSNGCEEIEFWVHDGGVRVEELGDCEPTFDFAANQNYNFEVLVSGSTVSVTVDGTPECSGTVTPPADIGLNAGCLLDHDTGGRDTLCDNFQYEDLSAVAARRRPIFVDFDMGENLPDILENPPVMIREKFI